MRAKANPELVTYGDSGEERTSASQTNERAPRLGEKPRSLAHIPLSERYDDKSRILMQLALASGHR